MRINSIFVVIFALLGMPLAHAVEVVVGQVGPMSGLDANQGRAYAVGMQLMFNNINKAGGINGHTFALIRKDDGGRAENTVSVTKQLLSEERPLVLAGFFGNRNITDVVNSGLLEANSIAVVGYRTTEIRVEAPLLYSVRAGLRDEINKITEHLATVGINRIGLFYEDGPGAASLLSATDEAAKKTAGNVVSKASYATGTARVTPAVEVFVKTAPQAIIMVASGAAAAAFIEQYRAAGGASQLLSHSGADIEQLSKRLSEEQLRGVAIAQVVPNPYKISVRLAKEFSDTIAKAQSLEVPASYTMMEGYIAAKVIVEAVRRQGKNPNRAGMVTALDGMENYDLGGYLVSFKPGMHSGAKFVELSIISGSGKIRQ
ncbi:ABC transporter substrate-binding protein [Polaromonas sp. LjRoot131]|uniref:ABC transporter substrate-binding protein n=1 Tax=Polaromonas sp. LjRoot131 TaxID=3342262 RepID=UPI003ECFE130